MPATCADPDCEADHGYEGSVASDDISLRISADAEGEAGPAAGPRLRAGAVGEHRPLTCACRPARGDALADATRGPAPTPLRRDRACRGAARPSPRASACPVCRRRADLALPDARRAVVVLVDGLGYELIRRRGGHAPFLRSLLPAAYRITAGFPSTTATSMGTFGTGLPPGRTACWATRCSCPARTAWSTSCPGRTAPTRSPGSPRRPSSRSPRRAGVSVTRVGPGFFDGSGLTRAALRGGRFRAADTLADRRSLSNSTISRIGRLPYAV